MGCFGVTGRTYRERGAFFVTLAEGRRMAKILKTSEHPAIVQGRYFLLEALAAAGFENTDRIVLSVQDSPCVNLGRETYIMTRHRIGAELNFENEMDVLAAFEGLSKLHDAGQKLGQVLQKPQNQIYPPVALPLTTVWERQIFGLKQALKQVNNIARLSDFDVLFLKNANQYMKRASDALAALAATDYVEMQAEAAVKRHLCHNALKEENFVIFDNDGVKTCFITRFNDAASDLQLTDLSAFIRRYAQRSARTIPMSALLKSYGLSMPLPPHMLEILHAQLLYPWIFMKITAQYYSKKRGFTPAGITSRMTDLLEAQAGYDEYIRISD